MKRLSLFVLALMTLNAFAQEEAPMKEQLEFTPEQIATLQTKRMALQLDLDRSQQTKLQALNLDHAKERLTRKENMREKHKQNEKPSTEERYNIANERLDKALSHKSAMKSILNKEQYEKWEKGRQKKQLKRKQLRRGKMMKRKRMQKMRQRH